MGGRGRFVGVGIDVYDSHEPKIRQGRLATSFAWLAPGAYEVRVTGPAVTPVTAPVLIWTPEPSL